MFNHKQVQRFSIRKLTVGAASVLIGIGFLSVDNNKAQAAENTNTDSDVTNKADDGSAQEIAKQKQVEQQQLKVQEANQTTEGSNTSDSKIQQLQVAKDDKTTEAAKKDEVKQTVKVNIVGIDDSTGQSLYGSKQGDFKPGEKITIYTSWAGYKLMNPEALSGLTSSNAAFSHVDITVPEHDVDITLHFAPLAPTKVEYVDTEGNLLTTFTDPSNHSTSQSIYHEENGIENSKVMARAINIPGYELVSDPVVEKEITQTSTKDNPNTMVIKFVYKKIADTAQEGLPDGGGSGISGKGTDYGINWAKIEDGVNIDLTKDTYAQNNFEEIIKNMNDRYTKQGFSFIGVINNHKDSDKTNRLETMVHVQFLQNKPVTVNYVDEEGNKLADSVTIAYNKNNPDQANDGLNAAKNWYPEGQWKSEQKDINGYVLKKVLGATEGKFTTFGYTVTYVYSNEAQGTITYIDDTAKTTLATDPLKGQIGAVIDYKSANKIADYENKGYKLISTNYQDGKEKFQEKGNNFEIHLVHDLVPVDPEHPHTPGDKINPNDPDPEGPKYPEGTDKANLTHVVSRVVNYVDENGKSIAGSVTETATMTGAGVLDKVTGEWTTPLTWADGSFKEVNTPKVEGYHVTGVTTDGKIFYNVDKTNGNVSSTVVTHEDGNTVVNVHFTKDAVAANGKVTYIDDTTKTTLKTDEFKGNVGDPIDYKTAGSITDYGNKGYKLVSNNFKDGNETFTKDGNNFEVHFVHDLVPVTPENPGKPGQPINPNNPTSPKYPDKTTTTDLTKTITRTVNYVDENGKSISNKVTQTVTLTGKGVLDKVTGEWTTPLTWNDGSFDKVATPSIDGYHVDKVTTEGKVFYSVDKDGNVSETKVNNTNGDTNVTVHFTKNQVPVTPDKPVNPSPEPQPQPQPTPDPEPVTPTEPDIPAPHGEDVPTKPEGNEEQPQEPETVMPHEQDVPDAPEVETSQVADPVSVQNESAPVQAEQETS